MNNCARRVVIHARRVGRNPVVRRVARSGALLRKTLVREHSDYHCTLRNR